MAKSLSGEELKKIPAELEKKEKELDNKEAELNTRATQIEEEHTSNKDKLSLMEKDIQEQCLELDKKEKDVEDKIRSWKELHGIIEGEEAFSKFYTYINQMYSVWIATRGSSDGMYESIQKIIEARNSMIDTTK